VAYPRERARLLDQLELRVVALSVVAGVALLLCLTSLLWRCGFFKRFEPHQQPAEPTAAHDQHSLTTTSDEDADNNDVVDIANSTSQPARLDEESRHEFAIYSEPRRLDQLQLLQQRQQRELQRQRQFEQANYAEPGVVDRDDTQVSTFQSAYGQQQRVQRERAGLLPGAFAYAQNLAGE